MVLAYELPIAVVFNIELLVGNTKSFVPVPPICCNVNKAGPVYPVTPV